MGPPLRHSARRYGIFHGRLMASMNVLDAATIADLRALARRRLPRAVFDFIDGGADDELTLRWNGLDLEALEGRPRVLVDVSNRDTSTVILARHTHPPPVLPPSLYAS